MNSQELQISIKNALELNDFQQLEKLFDIMVKDNYNFSTDPEILYAFASLELHKMNEVRALEYLDAAINLKTDFKAALELRSFLHKNLQNEEESLQDLNHLLNLEPENQAWRLQRIDLLKQMEDREGIESDFNFLIRKDPLDINFRVLLGEYYMEIAEYQEAVYCYSDVIDIEKKNGTTTYHPYLKRGNAHLNNGDFNKAAEDFKLVLKMNAESSFAYLGLATCAESAKKTADALSYLDLGLDMVTEDRWKLYQKKAEIAKALPDWDEVESAYKGMTRDIQGKAEGYFQLGLLYLRQGEKALAFEMLKEAENNFHEKAEDLINTHCQDFLQSDKKAEEKNLIEIYADNFSNNAASPLLKNVFNKLWKLDEKKTASSNEVLNKLASEMREKILETFKSMLVQLSPKGFYIFNSGQEDSRALYIVDEESDDSISLQLIRFDSPEPQLMNLKYSDNYLVIYNLGGTKTDLNLYFQPCIMNQLPDKMQKEFADKVASGATTFLN